jgi:PleD family two-component response regulator
VGRIRESLLGMNIVKGRPVTLSIGVITNTGRHCAFGELITAADGLMYEAKHGGKNTVRSGTLAGG